MMKEFKDKRGAHRTESLFVETIQHHVAKKYEPIYSLRDYDHKDYPSAYQIYMSSVDEYEAAMSLVGSMTHWRKLCALKWFMDGRPECQFDGLNSWRIDLEARDHSTAKRTLIDEAENGSVAAARALLDKRVKVSQSKKAKKEKIDDAGAAIAALLNGVSKNGRTK